MGESPTPTELAAMRARHRRVDLHAAAPALHPPGAAICAGCGEAWPCDTDAALRAYAWAARQAVWATDEAARLAARYGAEAER